MRRSVPSGPRGVLEVDWPFFGEICRALALRVARDYQPEIVLGVAKAGVIPGVVVASILQSEFTSMTVTRREEGAAPGAGLRSACHHPRAPRPGGGRDLRHRQHDEARAQRGPRPQARRSADRRLLQDRRIRARLSTPSRPRASSSCPGTGRSSRAASWWSGRSTPPASSPAHLQPWRRSWCPTGVPSSWSAPDAAIPEPGRSAAGPSAGPARPTARALHFRRRPRRRIQPGG